MKTIREPRRTKAACISVCGFALALALVVLPSAAVAAPCPNEARRLEQDSTYLPECRAFEQVSPIDKGEHDAVTMGNEEGLPVQASETGSALGFIAPSPLPGPGGSAALFLPYVSERGSNGWVTQALAAPTRQRPPSGAFFSRYYFSSDLSHLTFTAPLQQLVPDAPADVVNLYTLDRATGSYSLLTSAAPREPIPPGCAGCFSERDLPSFFGGSTDASRAIFGANEALAPGVPTGELESLYENIGGRVVLAGVLPDGSVPGGGGAAAGAAAQGLLQSEPYAFFPTVLPIASPSLQGQIENAISADGSRIVFAAEADAEPEPAQVGTVQLFDRVEGDSEGLLDGEGRSTLELSKPTVDAPTGGVAGPARYWAANPDGSRVLFSSRQELTADSNTGGEAEGSDLYEATVAEVGGETVRTGLVDLTPDPEGLGADVLGVVGTSRDLEYVYFAAEGALPGVAPNSEGAQPVKGKPNLYLAHGGALTFIGTLASKPTEEPELPGEPGEAPSGESGRLRPGDEYDWSTQPARSQAYATPDGRHLAFMSINNLTGADNIGQLTGRAVSEVYEYNAEGDSLKCASCNPEGTAPIGNAYLGARNNATGNGIERFLLTTATPLHHPRYMTADGTKLFFTSPDPGLLGEGAGERIADTHARIYEYTDGHAFLISAPESSLNEEFLDASESGEDVYISTRNRLAPSDNDSDGDIYDVKVGGGFPASVNIFCGDETACRGSSATSGPIKPSSVTSETVGPSGNLKAAAGRKKEQRRTARRRRLLKKALIRCGHRPAKGKKRCMAKARKRFGKTPGHKDQGPKTTTNRRPH